MALRKGLIKEVRQAFDDAREEAGRKARSNDGERDERERLTRLEFEVLTLMRKGAMER